jgi:hypothetical protein
MKECTYCGKEYPDEASVCAIDGQPIRDVMPPPPVAPASPVMTAPNITHRRIAHGTLSHDSFFKLSVIAAIGCLPVLTVLCVLAFLVGLARGHNSADVADVLVFRVWRPLLLNVIKSAVIVAGSGFLAGLCGYSFYAWLCRRRGGIVLKGAFEVLSRANDGELLRDVMTPPPVAPASPVMIAPNITRGRLSLGSFIKLSVIAAIGCLPFLPILFLVDQAQGQNSDIGVGNIGVGILLLPILVPFLFLVVIWSPVIVAGAGFFAGLCGYPFYAWLCRRPGGFVLKGDFEVF